jgi:sugar phosphate permease
MLQNKMKSDTHHSGLRNIHYGWVIVFACFAITFAGLGLVNSMSGVLLKPICDSLGFSRGDFTFHRTILILTSAVLMPVYGRIYDRIGVKKVLTVSSIALALFTFAYSFASQIWHFYLIALLNGIFVSGPGFMTAGYLINKWFDDKRGFAIGIAYAGAGIGAALFIPIVGQMAERRDWMFVYRFIGIAVLVVLLPIVLFLIKERPQDIALMPYKDKKNTQRSETFEGEKTSLLFNQAVKTPVFWMLLLAFFLLSIMAGGPNFNVVPYLTDIGYTAVFASIVMSALMLMHMLGNITLGGFFDRFGMLKGSIFLSLCCLVFPIFALNSSLPVLIWVFVLFYGPASAGWTVPAALFATVYFGKKSFAAIFSVINMVGMIGTALSGPSMAVIYDMTGSYFWAWIMLLGFGAIIAVCLIGSHFLNRKTAVEGI